MLAAKGLHKHFGQRAVVRGVDLSVERGEILGLLGPNGAGKTTTFYMILGLIRPDAGDVWLDDDLITHVPVHVRARRGVGYLAQDPSIFRGLTVEQNIVAGGAGSGRVPERALGRDHGGGFSMSSS